MVTAYFLVVIQVLIIVLVVTSLICFFRVVFGPTVADRIVGLNTISTKATVVLVLLAVLYERFILLDAAIAFAMLNITGSLVVSKYMEGGFRD
jgi:multicomponent Na+:H+ antiporter subunit F